MIEDYLKLTRGVNSNLARISQKISAAALYLNMPAAFRFLEPLDVPTGAPPVLSVASLASILIYTAPVASLTIAYTKPLEKCGPESIPVRNSTDCIRFLSFIGNSWNFVTMWVNLMESHQFRQSVEFPIAVSSRTRENRTHYPFIMK